ncbi:MAG: hypothetical protein A3K53_08785 [Deltaproteobacteria bacterium RIFOXYB2_FULL_66_7]|nr:MAG: hypothetical protein A3K53_08785 [Deltaproteobacteria bacterium RIFOXYB2_FULL_66_7]
MARQRYLFAAYFSTGVMIPMGYEYGFKKRLNVVKTRPQDWEAPTYDLSPFVKGVNRMKKNCPVLLEEGPQTRVNPKGEPVALLLKSRESRKGRVLAVINTTSQPQEVAIPDLGELLGKPRRAWRDLTPDTIPLKLQASLEFILPPTRLRLFYNPDGPPLPEEAVKAAK